MQRFFRPHAFAGCWQQFRQPPRSGEPQSTPIHPHTPLSDRKNPSPAPMQPSRHCGCCRSERRWSFRQSRCNHSEQSGCLPNGHTTPHCWCQWKQKRQIPFLFDWFFLRRSPCQFHQSAASLAFPASCFRSRYIGSSDLCIYEEAEENRIRTLSHGFHPRPGRPRDTPEKQNNRRGSFWFQPLTHILWREEALS